MTASFFLGENGHFEKSGPLNEGSVYENMRDRGYILVDIELDSVSSITHLIMSWHHTFKGAFSLPQETKVNKGLYRSDQQVAVGYRREDQREFLETRMYREVGDINPSFPEVLSYDATVIGLFQILSRCAEKVLIELLSAIGLDPLSILDLTDLRERSNGAKTEQAAAPSSSLLRICSYPPCPNSSCAATNDSDAGIAFGAHTDTSFLTIAPVSPVHGLEVYDRMEKAWVAAECQTLPARNPNTLRVVAFVGEFLQVLTKTHFKALIHRVRCPGGDNENTRFSCPLIIRGKNNVMIDMANASKYTHREDSAQHIPDLDGVPMKMLHKILDVKRQKVLQQKRPPGESWVLMSYPETESVVLVPATPTAEPSEPSYGPGGPSLLFSITLFLSYGFYSVIKRSFNVSMSAMTLELALTKTDLGLISSAFATTYGASKLLGGILSDYCSNRMLFVAGLVLGSICNILLACASSVPGLVFAWSVNGLVQGAGLPALQALISKNYNKGSLGTAWSIMLCGCNLGYLVTPFMLLPVIEQWNWRVGVAGCGIVGVALGLFTAIVVSEKGSAALKSDASSTGSTFLHALYSPQILLLLLASGLTYLTLKTIADWSTLFFVESWGLPSIQAAEVVMFSELGGIAGTFVSGVACDRLLNGNTRFTSSLFSFMCGASFLGLIFAPTVPIARTSLFLAGMFINGPKTLLSLAVAQVAPKEHVGAYSGLLGLTGQVGSAISGSGVAWLLTVHGWHTFVWSIVITAWVLSATLAVSIFGRVEGKEKRE